MILILALALCLAVAGLSVASKRLRMAPPIVMLLAGLALAFAPGAQPPKLDHQFVLLVLLPPLLYTSGVGMSWRGFRSNLRPILLLAVGCVLFTAAGVAALTHYGFGFPWAVGFVLGAIVSPPDSVAPLAIVRTLRLPTRIARILEGESLVNDATALVAFGIALGAVSTGSFSLANAVGRFAAVVAGEIGFGILVGWGLLAVRRWANDARAEILFALATPYIAFWPPHAIGGSGVVACVVAGLYVSWNGRLSIRPATRLQGYFFWDLLSASTEGLIFLLTGLQARHVISALDGGGLERALALGLAVTLALVVIRFAWVFPATYLARLIPAIRRREPSPPWRQPFLIAFTGLRGVVSLAAALSIPSVMGGKAFPDLDLVLFATFFVIVVTLVGLGSTLPLMVRALGLDRLGAREMAEARRVEQEVRLEALDKVLAAIDAAEAQGASPKAAAALRRQHGERRLQIATTADEHIDADPVSDSAKLQQTLIDTERAAINQAYLENRLRDSARRRIEREFDLEEARLIHATQSALGETDAA